MIKYRDKEFKCIECVAEEYNWPLDYARYKVDTYGTYSGDEAGDTCSDKTECLQEQEEILKEDKKVSKRVTKELK